MFYGWFCYGGVVNALCAEEPVGTSFESAVRAGLGTWPRGTVFLVAVSGGGDSTAMLAALAALRREAGFVLYCLHVDHGLRPPGESRGDARAVRELCAGFDVPCRVVSIPSGRIAAFARSRGTGIEGAARLFRRRAWNRESRRVGAERVLVAHTRDDLVETLLMRFLRGSGPEGLAAMPRERGRILRPLLELTRSDVLAYLAERGIPFQTDATNGDNRYLRNRIRNRLIPFLNELFPHWEKPALFLAETQRLTADFLRAEAVDRIRWRSREGAFVTGADAFFSQPGIVREEALFRLIDDHQLKGKGSAVPRRASLRLFTQGKFPAMDLGPVRVLRRGDQVMVTPGKVPAPEEGFALLIKRPGIYRLKGLFVEVIPSLTAEGEPPGQEDMKIIRCFFSGFPLVLRRGFQNDCIINTKQKGRPSFILDREEASRYTDIIVAEDAKGPAAVIGVDGKVLFRREEGDAEFFFIVSGGINVQ